MVVAADLARRRQGRGLKLNYPEAVAILTASHGTTLLKREEVMEGVADMIHEVQVEATFPDGTKLVTVHHPIR